VLALHLLLFAPGALSRRETAGLGARPDYPGW
jgi:hypothetical protein